MKNIMRILLALSLIFVMTFAFSACDSNEKTATDSSSVKSQTLSAADDESSEETKVDSNASENIVKAEIVIKEYGTIKLDLYADEAPISVANFVKLANDKFYDNVPIHRIMKGFMMQGGDPDGDGVGGSEEQIEGEFAANGHTNNISHIRGTISMARTGSNYEQYLAMGYKFADLPTEIQNDIKRAFNSGSSQFFIMHQTTTSLDGNYAAFGRVTDGMDVVDAICEDAKPTDDNGKIPADEQPIIETIRIVK